MKTYKIALSVAFLAIAILGAIPPSIAEEGDDRKTPDGAKLSQRVQELERRVSALEAIVRPAHEEETQAEMLELIDEAYRKLAMELVQISRGYADAVSENASPDELARQKKLLIRHCELLEKIAEKRDRITEVHMLLETHVVCPMHPERTGSTKSHCEICGMPKVLGWQVPGENQDSAEPN